LSRNDGDNDPAFGSFPLREGQAAFEARDFGAAMVHARAAEEHILDEVVVKRGRRKASPRYSIIILAQQDSADLQHLIVQVRPYLSDDFELLLVLNGFSAERPLYLPDDATVVRVGFNYGCAGGRNVAARLARGVFLIFLDDDGVLGEGSIEHLVETIQCYDAVAVRGRILPRTDRLPTPRHYDYGQDITYSAPDTEGLTVWRREEFLHFGGFDSLLAGHEGVALWSKMFRFYGPDSFLYAPRAVLYHDYAKTDSHRAEKKRQRTFNLTYLDHAYPTAVKLKSAIHRLREDTRTRILFARSRYTARKCAPEAPLSRTSVSVLTVAKNAGTFLDDYTQAMNRQTFKDFEVIFVDRGSTDGTADRLAALWNGDKRLRLLKRDGGRAECFNLALAEAAHDICVIAEVGDVSLPKRLELTVRHFLASSSQSLCFAEFSENELFRGAQATDSARLRTKSLLQSELCFGALSFLKSKFPEPFDTSLHAGSETKWLRDNLACGATDGMVVPLHEVFHGRAGARTDAEREAARGVELTALYATHDSSSESYPNRTDGAVAYSRVSKASRWTASPRSRNTLCASL
jgi:glycosyltransferase involved in cell wall biosynthesis